MLEAGKPSKVAIDFSEFPEGSEFCKVCNVVMNSTFLVSDKVFSRIVNDNLEVRTSVAIDPATGAAEDGALFTYEAIPRSTIMWFEVVYNKPEYFRINGQEIKKDKNADVPIRGNVEKGLILKCCVGGMNTRGMGRFRILNIGGAVHEILDMKCAEYGK